MLELLAQENNIDNNKIKKPDFSTRTGREFLAFYLQTKFKQIILHDRKSEFSIIKEVKPDFISKFSRRIIEKPSKRVLVGITGISASGKTTICKTIYSMIKKLHLPIEIVSTDNYFNDISEQIKIYKDFDNLRDSGYDVDSPESFQLDLLKEDLVKLSQGINVLMPQYLINGTGKSVPKSIPVISQKIILAEGMATMYKDVKDVFDVKIYVDIDFDTQQKWFMERAALRNQDQENAKRHFEYVQEASKKYILPFKAQADIIINGKAKLDYFSQIIEYIYCVTNNFID